MSFAVGALVTDEVLTIAEFGFYWTVVTAVLAAISAVLMFTADVQHGTLAAAAAAIAARPTRTDIALAKAVIAMLMGVAFGVLGIVAGFCGAALSGIDAGELSAVPATCAWAVMDTALSVLLGLGLARNRNHHARTT